MCFLANIDDLFSEIYIMFWSSKPLHNAIVAAPSYLEEIAHYKYRVLIPVSINDMVFYFRPHIISVDWRKSRNNLFSIWSLAISCSYCSFVLRGCLRGRPLRFGTFPCSIFALARFFLFIQFSIYRNSKPNSSAIIRLLIPASRIARICGSISCIFVHFLLLITIPPDVVIILQQGGSLSIVHFYWFSSGSLKCVSRWDILKNTTLFKLILMMMFSIMMDIS